MFFDNTENKWLIKLDFKVDFYTWPNPSFPFRLYFEHPNLRIFIIENTYNWIIVKVSKNSPETSFMFTVDGSTMNILQRLIQEFLIIWD